MSVRIFLDMRYQPYAAYIDGTYRCFTMPDGRHRHYSGCSHETPRQAIRHNANHPYTSPLRVSGTGSHPSPVVPPSGSDAELVPESPKADSTPTVAVARAVIPPSAT